MKKGLSVVIPAYNEEANVAACLKNVYSILRNLHLDWEIILVNDGSKDKTGLVAKQLAKKIPHLKVMENKPNQGYGGALLTGFKAATKEFIAFVPADNQFDFSQIRLILDRQATTGADLISGIRPNGGHDPFYRKIYRWGWNTLVRALFGFLAQDIDCGFKLFRRSLLKSVKLTSRGAMIDTQLLAGIRARGYSVSEVEVRHLPRTAGQSTGGNPKVIFKALKELTIFWWQLKQEILVEQGRAVFRWEALILLAIVLLAAFLRLYRIDQYMTFLGDEGRDVLVVRDMLLVHKFTLIGPGTSIGNMYLGPLYYYLMLIPLLVAGFSPVGPAVFVALVSLLTVILIWWMGRQWFGRISALFVALLYSVSPTVITYSHSSWNPNIMPFFALLSMYALWKVWRYGYWRWLIVMGISMAFVLNSHYLGLLLVPQIVIYLLFSRMTPSALKHLIAALVVFALLMSPLFLFDLRHDWVNARAIYTFFTNRQTTVNLKVYKAVPNLWPIWQQIITSLLSANQINLGNITSLVLAIFLPVIVYLRAGKKYLGDFLFLMIWIISGLVGLGIYKQHIYDHYFGFLWPAIFLLCGYVFEEMWSARLLKIVSIFVIFYLLWVNLTFSPIRFPPNMQMSHTRQIADFLKTEAQGRPFNLALLAKTNYDAGYRYFLALNQAPYYTIHQQITGQLFVICETSPSDCQPINNPLWEIASFGWAKVDRQWEFPWGVKVVRLVHNPSGQPPGP